MRAVVFQIKADTLTFTAIAVEMKDEYSRDRQRILSPVEGRVLLSIKPPNEDYWASEHIPDRWYSGAADAYQRKFASSMKAFHQLISNGLDSIKDGDVVELSQYAAQKGN